MTTDRKAYRIDPSNPGSDLAGETAAAMAAASIVFRRSNPAYSRLLLSHAYQVTFLFGAIFTLFCAQVSIKCSVINLFTGSFVRKLQTRYYCTTVESHLKVIFSARYIEALMKIDGYRKIKFVFISTEKKMHISLKKEIFSEICYY